MRAPSVEDTLSAEPLPDVPAHLLNDPEMNATLRDHPHLFSIVTPIDVDRFEELLLRHPNRPAVESMVKALREGAWPASSGDIEAIKEQGRGAVRRGGRKKKAGREGESEEERRFRKAFEEEAAAEVAHGRYSAAFDTLLPGMVASPQFIIPRDGGRLRIITDESVSGLNSSIDREKNGAQLREQPDVKGVLWKSDISSAFRLIPVHYRFQLLQVVQVNDVFHVDRNACFGGSFFPKLWCTFMGFVCWIARERGISYPTFFVDDQYGFDTSGEWRSVDAYGETHTVPRDQAITLELWKELRLPFSWKKQVSGPSLPITGIQVNSADWSFSLTEESKEKFDSFVKAFLAHTGASRPNLGQWQSLVGYCNWALNVVPQSTPAMGPIYGKLNSKLSELRDRGEEPKRTLLINIPADVRTAVRWLHGSILGAPPLLIRSIGATMWPLSSADLVVTSDACLASRDTGTTGIAFWAQHNGVTGLFRTRLAKKSDDIFFSELMGVLSGIVFATQLPSPPKRLICRTDNSLTVWLFQRGWGRGVYGDGLRAALELADRFGISIVVTHIRGVDNGLADAGSRLSDADIKNQYAASYTPLFIQRFELPRRLLSDAYRDHVCLADEADLNALRLGLVEGAIEQSTRSGYGTALREWKRFTDIYEYPFRPTIESLGNFIAFLIRRISSVQTYLSGLAFFFAPIYDDWGQIRNAFETKRALAGALKWRAHRVSRKAALRIPHLRRIVGLAVAGNYDDLLFAAVTVVGFFALHRLGELTVKAATFDDRKAIRRDSVSWEGDHLVYWLPYHKADRFFKGNECRVDSSLAPGIGVRQLLDFYVAARDLQNPSSPFFLVAGDGKPPTYSWWVGRIQRMLGSNYAGHSLRSGGATFLAEIGAADVEIQRMGRWAGPTFEQYLREHPAVFFALARSARLNGRPVPSMGGN